MSHAFDAASAASDAAPSAPEPRVPGLLGAIDRAMKAINGVVMVFGGLALVGLGVPWAIVAFVTVRGHVADEESGGEAFAKELRDHVAREIGPIAKPRQILIAPELPKTRSGKIMRRFLRQIAAGRAIEGDTSTLEDPGVLERLAETDAV